MAKIFFSILLLITFLIPAQPAHAESGNEFFTSVIYGTIAGTLVGAATLAFTSSPSDNLMNIARGASLGLYAGILLGLYVTYGVDDTPSTSEGPPSGSGTGSGEGQTPPQGYFQKKDFLRPASSFQVAPAIGPQGAGLAFNFRF